MRYLTGGEHRTCGIITIKVLYTYVAMEFLEENEVLADLEEDEGRACRRRQAVSSGQEEEIFYLCHI